MRLLLRQPVDGILGPGILRTIFSVNCVDSCTTSKISSERNIETYRLRLRWRRRDVDVRSTQEGVETELFRGGCVILACS